MIKKTLIITGVLLLTACGNEPDVVLDQPTGLQPITSSSSSSISSTSSASSEASVPSVTSAAPKSSASSVTSVSSESIVFPTPSTSNPPASVRINMSFAPQAPTGSWDPPYDEACEEASLIIVHHYLEQTALDNSIMDRDIQNMVAYETSIGLPIDIDMHELARVAEGMYGYSTEVVEGASVTADRIVQELAQGNPVIVPLAGQDIGNPYYSGDGPPYHVLVIVGYNQTQFITHDVGTKRGENYVYNKSTIMSAIHDWNGSVDTIRSGAKRILVVKKL